MVNIEDFIKVIKSGARENLSPLDSKEIKPVNQEISSKYSLERLMLKLKLQCFGPPDTKRGLIGKDPDAGKD